jgi:hypothetical protein
MSAGADPAFEIQFALYPPTDRKQYEQFLRWRLRLRRDPL